MNESEAAGRAGAPAELLRRTRTAVLNVLVVMAALIAASGWVLRRRAGPGFAPPARALHEGLLLALVAVAVVSHVIRRAGVGRPEAEPLARRASRFYWSHVGAAASAAVGIVLGLIYGSTVEPRLEGVIPFWVVPLAPGLLAIPRRRELVDLDLPKPKAPSP